MPLHTVNWQWVTDPHSGEINTGCSTHGGEIMCFSTHNEDTCIIIVVDP